MALVNAFSLGVSSIYYISRTLSPCPVAARGLSENRFISDFCGVRSSRCQCPPLLPCFPEHLKTQRFYRFICCYFSTTIKITLWDFQLCREGPSYVWKLSFPSCKLQMWPVYEWPPNRKKHQHKDHTQIKIPFVLVRSSLWIIYGLLGFGVVIWSNYMLIGIFLPCAPPCQV